MFINSKVAAPGNNKQNKTILTISDLNLIFNPMIMTFS